jgi:D-alanine-D-alanine ligase
MRKNPKRALVLFDLPERIAGHDDPRYLLENTERPTERDVARAVKGLGLELHTHGVFDDIKALWKKLETLNPDVVINLCETYRGDRSHEGDVASLLELSGISYTGSGPSALHLCKDKGATKKIAGWDGVKVPGFKVFPQDQFHFVEFPGRFPLIVKPLNREASEGISQASIVGDWSSCEERATWVAQKLRSDVIVEEYIHGRELYVGMLEYGGVIKALPPRELFMMNLEKKEPMVATYRAKWDDAYRKKWGISTGTADDLSKDVAATLADASVKMFRALGLRGYARLDWRLMEDGTPVFLEANPNPALSQDDDFAKAAKSAGYAYGELIAEIIGSALWSSTEQYKISESRAGAQRPCR